MPSHTKAEKKKAKKETGGVGNMLLKTLPGQFAKGLFGSVNKKLKDATGKKKKK